MQDMNKDKRRALKNMAFIFAKTQSLGQDMATLSSSIYYYEKAKTLMPGGVNSPVRAAKALGITPLVVEKATGSRIISCDGKSYIDACMSWGAIILGHADSYVQSAVINQLDKGSSYGALCLQEIELAERLIKHMPHLEKIRFVSSGTESTMSALRLARGFTGRPKIVKFSGNYHGHHDALLKNAGSFLAEDHKPLSLGVTQDCVKDTVVIPYNNLEALGELEALGDKIAAIIFEPVCGNMDVVLPKYEFLRALEAFCAKFGALLIVDEVMTGFRTQVCGASADFSIKGDLYCYGKIIGGGLPCAFFGGRADVMDYLAPEGGVFQAGTLSGNPLAMAAGLAVTDKLLENHTYSKLQKKADLLLDDIELFIKNHHLNVCLNRYGSMFTVFFGVKQVSCFEDLVSLNHAQYVEFYKMMLEEGVFLSPSQYEACFLSLSHTEEDLLIMKKAIMKFLQTLC
jgi:glutamate-1-semialdehyde 2,1-aminomutase